MSSDDNEDDDTGPVEDGKNGCLSLILLVIFFLVYGFIEFLGALPRWSRRIAGKKDV